MTSDSGQFALLNHLRVGISIVTWLPETPRKMDWVFVNDARCRMTGFTREEITSKPPVTQASRETRALVEKTNHMLETHGYFASESTLIDRDENPVPVMLHMTLIDLDGTSCLFTEQHDISSYKETESLLERSRESTQEMLMLIDKGKKQLTANVRDNLGLVLFPLIDQLRITATDSQKEILDFMAGRIHHLAREMGVAETAGTGRTELTRRQTLICEMIRDGMTSKEMALALGCSPSTINNHRNQIRRKLGLTGSRGSLQAHLNRSGG